MEDDDLIRVEEFIRFIFFPVGHGCCVLVSFPPEKHGSERVYGVIDCKDSTARPIREYLSSPWFIGESPPIGPMWKLRFVILTHYHQDHYLGLDHLLGDGGFFSHEHFLCPLPAPGVIAKRIDLNSSIKKRLSNIQELAPSPDFLFINKSLNWVYKPDRGDLNKVKFDIMALAPSNKAITKMKEWESIEDVTPANILSSAIRFQWGHCVAVIGGDVEDKEWSEIISDFRTKGQLRLLPANMALAPHHGGEGNSHELWQILSRCSDYHKPNEDRDRRLSLTLAVISCGNNKKGSPSRDTLQIFSKVKVAVRCTALSEECINHFKGQGLPFNGNNRRNNLPDTRQLHPSFKISGGKRAELFPFARSARDYRKDSICIDIFPKKEPRCYRHDGSGVVPLSNEWPYPF